MAMGTVTTEQLGRSLLKLYICLRRKRALPNLNDSTKKVLDDHLIEVLKLLFLHYDNIEGDQ